jgi:hypothetical protein
LIIPPPHTLPNVLFYAFYKGDNDIKSVSLIADLAAPAMEGKPGLLGPLATKRERDNIPSFDISFESRIVF